MKRLPLPRERIWIVNRGQLDSAAVYSIRGVNIHYCACVDGTRSRHKHHYGTTFVRRFDEGVTWVRDGVDSRALQAALMLLGG